MLVSLNDNHARIADLAQTMQTVKLLVSACTGSFGFGDWGNGYWIKHAEFWDAQSDFSSAPSTVKLPYKVGKAIAKVYDVTSGNATLYNVYLSNTRVLTIPAGIVGRPIIIELNNVKNVKE